MRLAPATPIVVGAAIDTVIIIVFVIIIISHIGESPIRDIIIITNTLCSELQPYNFQSSQTQSAFK